MRLLPPSLRALRPRDLLSEQAATILAVTIAALAVAWPVLRVEYLPFVDYPQHLATIAAIHGRNDPAFSHLFVVHITRSQYLLYYLLSDLLAYPFGVELGTKILTAASFAALPVSVAFFLRAHGRPAILGALAGAIAIHVWVFWGFINFAMALPIAIAALAVLARLLETPTWQRAAWFGALTAACFYTHAQIYCWLVLAALAQVLATVPAFGVRRAWQGAWRGLVAAVPSALGAMLWLHASAVLERGEAGRGSAPEFVAAGGATWEPVGDVIHRWLDHSFDVYNDGSDELIAVLFGLLLIALIAMRGSQKEPDRRPSFGPEAVLLVAVLGYLFAPISYKLIQPINERFLPLAFALTPVLGPRIAPQRVTTWVLAAAFVLLSCFVWDTHATHFSAVSDEMGDLGDALAHTHRGRRLVGLIYDRGSAQTHFATFLHAEQYYQARVGGLAEFSFAEFTKSPIGYAPGAEPPPFAPRFEWTPERFDYDTYADYFDYYLIRHPPGQTGNPFLRARNHPPPNPLYEGDRWSLYGRGTAGE